MPLTTIPTSDGEALQAELHHAVDPALAVVVTHPNPLMGGDMYTPVPAALFGALEDIGATGVRFNFRGVGQSSGSHDKGDAERLDVVAAIDLVTTEAPGVPVIVAGWSFGADVALAVDDPRIGGWFLAAAPLKVHEPTTMPARTAAAPKRFAVPEHDQFAPPATIADATDAWVNTSAVTIPGVDHFFGGLMAPLVEQFAAFVTELDG